MNLVRFAAFLAAALVLAGCGKAPPTDNEMAASFRARRAAFETLRTDLCKLKYDLTVMRDPPWAQPQMPPADEKRLRALLGTLGAAGVKYIRGCQLWIEVWSAGVGEPAAYKKYRYGPPLYRIIEIKEPPPKDLNDYLDKRVAIASFEKNIEGDWWIELDHWR
ncbi:MAG: hypothetical protein WDM86_21680 [Rhizomicrobium sp.]